MHTMPAHIHTHMLHAKRFLEKLVANHSVWSECSVMQCVSAGSVDVTRHWNAFVSSLCSQTTTVVLVR